MNLRLNLTSAGGLLALLDEPQSQVQGYALEKLNDVVDVFWAEIADAVDKIEVRLRQYQTVLGSSVWIYTPIYLYL